MASTLFRFPNPVNEVSTRLVAAGVVLISASASVFDRLWLTGVIATATLESAFGY